MAANTVGPLCFGHRGARAYEPENTLLSFETAIRMGVDGIELDVYQSKDGHVVVTHSDALEIDGQRYRVSKLDLDEIKSIPLQKGQRLPTLDEVFETATMARDGNPLLYSIDLKDMRAASAYHDVLQRHDVLDRTLTCLESRMFIKKVHRSHPDLSLVYSTHVNPEGVLEDLDKVDPAIVSVVNLPASEATAAVLTSIKDAGLRAFVWDVNEVSIMNQFVPLADGLYSDYPDLLVKAARSSC